MRKFLYALCISATLFAGPKRPDASLYQCSTFGALMSGAYKGEMKVSDLMKKGNFGIGVFEGLDSEMVAFNGQFYRFDGKGTPKVAKNSAKLAYATLIFFNAGKFEKIKNLTSMKVVEGDLDKLIKNRNTPHAVRISGVFRQVEMRNLQEQKAPYPNLAVARQTEKTYTAKKIKGTAIGFWFPEYLSGVSVPGFHFQFLADDKSVGGHILEMSIEKGQVSFQEASDLDLFFPKDAGFSAAQLNQDFTAAIQEVNGPVR